MYRQGCAYLLTPVHTHTHIRILIAPAKKQQKKIYADRKVACFEWDPPICRLLNWNPSGATMHSFTCLYHLSVLPTFFSFFSFFFKKNSKSNRLNVFRQKLGGPKIQVTQTQKSRYHGYAENKDRVKEEQMSHVHEYT